MTTYKIIELKLIIEQYNEVTITVEPISGDAYDLIFTNFDEAKNEIEILENENDVYF
jgi:hypothetical protein